MSEFISKVQHNNYEKGEFSEEKVRSLDETLELVRNFPFDAERTLTDIQLTGPSVTIQDENVNYLKVGLYFNSKLCIYYLDNDNHLYECYVLTIDAACDLVKDFFEGTLDLLKFEKHFFNIGNQAHFVTNYFEYKVKRGWLSFCFLVALFFLLIAGVGSFAIFKITNLPFFVYILYSFIDILALQTVILLSRMSLKTINMSLVISAGQDAFQFGDNGDLENYNKKDVTKVVIYGATSRSSRIFNLMELMFSNGSNIIVPGTLIEPFDFIGKFKGHNIDYQANYTKNLKSLWVFTK